MLFRSKRFGTSPERKNILLGWLEHRAQLTKIGFTEGYQWLDGSFVEDAETRLGRSPKDIDVVTFAARPSDIPDFAAFVEEHTHLFSPKITFARFFTDAYFVDLGLSALDIVDHVRYWHGLFSHRRATFEWKGMLQVPLLSDDLQARSILKTLEDQYVAQT